MVDRDLAALLHRLADHVDDLEPAKVAGALEELRYRVWHEPAPTPVSVTQHEPVHELTQREAARLRPALGLKLIRYLTRTGRVPAVPRGRQRLVRLADLDAYVARCRTEGVALGKILDVSSPHDRRRRA